MKRSMCRSRRLRLNITVRLVRANGLKTRKDKAEKKVREKKKVRRKRN